MTPEQIGHLGELRPVVPIAAAYPEGGVSPDTGTLARRLVIIGAGMVAARLLAEAAESRPGKYDVTVLGAEPHRPYNRILLSPLLAGRRVPRIWSSRRPTRFPACAFSLTIRSCRSIAGGGRRSPAPAPVTLTIILRLSLAVGSEPIRPALPGIDLPGVFTFRDRRDADALIDAANTAAVAVVVGGGLLGLEAACGLARRGIRVTVVHLMPWLMERNSNATAGALLQRSLEERGIEVMLASESEAVLGDVRAAGLRSEDRSGYLLLISLSSRSGFDPASRWDRTSASQCVVALSSTTV